MKKSTLIALLAGAALALAGAGCTSTKHQVNPQQDAAVITQDDAAVTPGHDGGAHDTALPPQDDAGPTCTNTGITPVAQGTDIYLDPTNGNALIYNGFSATTEPFDYLDIELYYTSTPPAVGTITLAGTAAERNYATCKNCVLVYQGCTSASGCTKIFLATGGTLDITAVGANGSHFTGTLANVTLEEVTIDTQTYQSTAVTGGDTWCLTSTPFDSVIGCNTAADCTTSTVGPICNATTHTCIECTTTTDCASSSNGPVCDTTSGACVECVANGDCSTSQYGHLCDTTKDYCVECLQTSDCASSTNGKYCDTTYGMCGCNATADCAGSLLGAYCDTNYNMCGCAATADCAAASGHVCDTSTGTCGCAANTDCAAATPKCDTTSSACVECLANDDCAANPHGTVCDTTTGTCGH